MSEEVSLSLVVTTWKFSSVAEILNTLESLGFKDIVVRGITCKKFLLTFLDKETFDNLDIELLGLGFLSCKIATVEDTIIPRIAFICCYGLPLGMWCIQNLINLISSFGELLGISPTVDAELVIINPVSRWKRISMIILISAKKLILIQTDDEL